ncbi:MAG: acylglycerol kinase family protein, partial [Thermoguttaceae bacterium]|nr:acylglycerol kinase family protein [Thermoguttaceae bacterium]
MTAQRQILISLNPKAGRRPSAGRAEELRSRLKALGYGVELLTNLNEVEQKASALFRAGELRALVGVGGDGTAAELVRRTPPGTPITLLPAGTANLLAKEFHLPFDPVR